MRNILILPLLVSLSILTQASEDMEKLAEEKCGACHLMGQITKEKLNRMSAPPYWALAKKVRIAYQDKKEQVNFIKDFVMNPSEEKMLFPNATKERFGLMPSQKGALSDSELDKITEYILN